MDIAEALRILADVEAREADRCGTCDGYGWVHDPVCPLEFSGCEAPCPDCDSTEYWPPCDHAEAR